MLLLFFIKNEVKIMSLNPTRNTRTFTQMLDGQSLDSGSTPPPAKRNKINEREVDGVDKVAAEALTQMSSPAPRIDPVIPIPPPTQQMPPPQEKPIDQSDLIKRLVSLSISNLVNNHPVKCTDFRRAAFRLLKQGKNEQFVLSLVEFYLDQMKIPAWEYRHQFLEEILELDFISLSAKTSICLKWGQFYEVRAGSASPDQKPSIIEKASEVYNKGLVIGLAETPIALGKTSTSSFKV